MQYPLSADEHAAITRYVSAIRKQLQDVADLFSSRYGKNSSIAESAVKTLVSSAMLEHELSMLGGESESSLNEEALAHVDDFV